MEWGKGNPRDNAVIGWDEKCMAEGRIVWKLRVEEPLEFRMELVYVAVEGRHGGSYTVTVDDREFSEDIVTQPEPITVKHVKYIPHELGTIRLEPGMHRITITGDKLTAGELFMPSSILLHRK